MTMGVGQLAVIEIDEARERVLDGFQHVIDIKRRTVMVIGDMDLHFVIERRLTSRQLPQRQPAPAPSTAGCSWLSPARTWHAQHHEVPRQPIMSRTIAALHLPHSAALYSPSGSSRQRSVVDGAGHAARYANSPHRTRAHAGRMVEVAELGLLDQAVSVVPREGRVVHCRHVARFGVATPDLVFRARPAVAVWKWNRNNKPEHRGTGPSNSTSH